MKWEVCGGGGGKWRDEVRSKISETKEEEEEEEETKINGVCEKQKTVAEKGKKNTRSTREKCKSREHVSEAENCVMCKEGRKEKCTVRSEPRRGEGKT